MAQSKWTELQMKVDNLAEEVFNEVVEHEMALAQLDGVNLEEVIPADTNTPGKRESLLIRMTNIQ